MKREFACTSTTGVRASAVAADERRHKTLSAARLGCRRQNGLQSLAGALGVADEASDQRMKAATSYGGQSWPESRNIKQVRIRVLGICAQQSAKT